MTQTEVNQHRGASWCVSESLSSAATADSKYSEWKHSRATTWCTSRRHDILTKELYRRPPRRCSLSQTKTRAINGSRNRSAREGQLEAAWRS